jgi:uncharacterized membrane protein
VDGLEASLAHVLQIGSYASIALVTAGVLLLAAGGVSPLDPGPALDLGRIPSDLVAGRPAGFLWLGIISVVATPGLRVALALVGFARRGERLMVLVAALILVVVAVGVLAGLVTG